MQQQPPQSTSNAPLYSPFVYQPQPTNVSHAHTPQQQQQQPQSQNPFAKAPNQSRSQQQQQYATNSVNFFNPTQFSDANANNNLNQYPSSQPPTFSFVQSPIPSSTVTTSLNSSNPQNVQFETVNNYQYQERHESSSQNQLQYPIQHAMVSYSNDQSSARPTSQPMIYSNVNQSRNVATPPTLMQNYDSNFNTMPTSTTQQHSSYQYPSWNNDQRTQSNESASWQPQQPVPMAQNAFSQQMPPIETQPQMPVHAKQPQMPPISSDWQNLQAPQVSQQMNFTSSNQPISSSAGYFSSHFEAPTKEEKPVIQEPKAPELPAPQIPTSNQYYQPNIENVQVSSIESALPSLPASIPQMQQPASSIPQIQQLPPSVPQMPPLPPTSIAQQPPKNPINEIPYPENRERLDDSVPTSQNNPVIPITTSSIDRHNYLVTGQLAQEVPAFSQQPIMNESFNENLPPPGLSRMVVGEQENNQEQVQTVQNDLLPPRSNRMVTGTEMTPASFMNYQRQADGEVSHEPSMQRQLPPFNVSQPPPPPMQQIPQQQDRIADMSDRNLYLVAGESDANSQRVITGVESDNSNMPSLINPLQNLHIEDDEDFVNISVTQMSRNVDGDGMEEQNLHLQNQIQHEQQREEEIEGANDNNNELNVNQQPVIEIPSIPPSISLSEQNSDIREDIEGANELSDPQKPQPVEFEEKRKSIDSAVRTNQKLNTTMSSEDSELRELEKNMKQKSRRSNNKKYDSDNDSESASLDEYKKNKSRDRYDDRYSKKNRDRVREELEKYKKREKERRSGGRRRNDDTDGSRYGDSRRRTDDEDDERRKTRNRREKKNDDEVDDDDKERERKDRRHRDNRELRRSKLGKFLSDFWKLNFNGLVRFEI